MLFYTSKLLAVFTYPIIWFVVLVFWGWRTKRARRKKRLFWAAAILFIVVHNHFLFNVIIRSWEGPPVAVHQVDHYEYAVLLGGYSNFALRTPEGTHPFSESANRLTQTLELFLAGKFDTLIVSGGSGRILEKERLEATEIIDFLVKTGVPREQIKVDAASKTTFESTLNVAPLVIPDTDILLLTSAWHMPRSAAVFRKAGFTFDTFPVDQRGEKIRWHPESLIIPDRSGFSNWELLTHEWIGLLMYWLAGKV